jgi:hypothetical protein
MTPVRTRRDLGRSIGALTGLAIGVLLMWIFGYSGVLYGFLFGAGGAVAGGMTGERLVGDSGLK